MSTYEDRGRVCFTGFNDQRRQLLEVMAESIGFRVVRSVSGKVVFLVAGEYAGAKKLEKARELDIEVITEERFLEIASIAEMTLEKGIEKFNALTSGEMRSDETRETANTGVCPYCRNMVIPMPKMIRKCPTCNNAIAPIGGILLSKEEVYKQFASYE